MKNFKLNAIIVFCFGLLCSSTASYKLHRHNIEETSTRFQSAAHDRYKALQQSINYSLLFGSYIASLYSSPNKVTKEQFTTFTQFILFNAPYIQALEWAPRVSQQNRSKFENTVKLENLSFHITERDANGNLVTAKIRDEYFPVYFVEPYKGNELALGFDLGSNLVRRRALESARDNNLPVSTGRINLVQNTPGEWGFLTFVPIYKNEGNLKNIKQKRNLFRGTIVIVYDIASLVELSLSYLVPIGINIEIYDKAAPSAKQLLYSHDSRLLNSNTKGGYLKYVADANANGDFVFTDLISVNNRTWSVKMSPIPDYFDTSIKFNVWLVFCGLILVFTMLAAYLQLLTKRQLDLLEDKQKLEYMVSQRTTDLEEKNRELESFSYSIAHDLRSPLRAITGFSQIIQEESSANLNNEQQDYLQRIVGAAKHMAQLIDDILALSRVTSAEFERKEVDMSVIAMNIIERLKQTNIDTKTQWLVTNSIKAKGDPQLLTMLLENLLINASKFSSHQANPKVEFGVEIHNDNLIYYVRDNGIGFDQAYAEKIFGVFQRLHPKTEFYGTGIGLATVKRIVNRHNGDVWAEAQQNQGATFYFTLPHN